MGDGRLVQYRYEREREHAHAPTPRRPYRKAPCKAGRSPHIAAGGH